MAAWSYATVQPACGHTASKATNLPAVAWTTIEGSPVRGSVNDAAPPTGTSLAGPIAVPAGWLTPAPLGPRELGAVSSHADEFALDVSTDDLPFEDLMGKVEKLLLEQALRRHGGNKARAAKALGLKRTTLLYKLKAQECLAGAA